MPGSCDILNTYPVGSCLNPLTGAANATATFKLTLGARRLLREEAPDRREEAPDRPRLGPLDFDLLERNLAKLRGEFYRAARAANEASAAPSHAMIVTSGVLAFFIVALLALKTYYWYPRVDMTSEEKFSSFLGKTGDRALQSIHNKTLEGFRDYIFDLPWGERVAEIIRAKNLYEAGRGQRGDFLAAELTRFAEQQAPFTGKISSFASGVAGRVSSIFWGSTPAEAAPLPVAERDAAV